ncbi:S-layer homology domain-containing protein [Bacillaceae bacterium SIJ1]|uniref:S-layer homology domain-containing protein n=1 Tax=Litoribacterium kuwaitense TaxID=1398745 RepID=UPI0013EBC686|nr:S-layer homology domain-containing protein [Litoribacterium kuwaitense]NGP44859.1 S-layer homology domain-containing protein [Litoribacterium kuwaitense]
MKLLPRWLLAACVLLLANLLPSPSPAEAVFRDVPSHHWADEAIDWGFDNGYVKGVNKENTLFKPNAPLTRAQWFAMLFRYLEDIQLQSPIQPQSWSSTVLETAVYYGYPIVAHEDGRIQYRVMDAPINRVEAADTIVYTFKGETFWYETETVRWMYDEGLAKGKKGENTFEAYEPFQSMTRAEGIQLLYQMDRNKRPDVDASQFQSNDAVYTITFPKHFQKLKTVFPESDRVKGIQTRMIETFEQMKQQMNSNTTASLTTEVNRMKVILQSLDDLKDTSALTKIKRQRRCIKVH